MEKHEFMEYVTKDGNSKDTTRPAAGCISKGTEFEYTKQPAIRTGLSYDHP